MLVVQYLLMGIRFKSSNVASQKSKKKALAAKVVCNYEIYQPIHKHRIAFLRLKFTVSFFSIL